MGDNAVQYREPRREFREDRWVTVAEVRRMIEQLDPCEDDAEIMHLSLEVRVPRLLAHVAYASGTARGMSHPAEAAAGYRGGTGQQIHDPHGRDADTLTFFGLFMREGHRSAKIQRILDRVQQVHHDVRGVNNDTQLHVLGLLIVEPERVVRDLGQPHFFSEKENLARLSFWRGIGQGMGLTGIWDSYDEVEPWLLAFEQKFGKPTDAAAQIYRGQVTGFERRFPGPLKKLAGPMLSAVLSDDTRRIVNAPTSPLAHRMSRGFLTAFVATEGIRRVNLNTTWVKNFSDAGEHPDIEKLGYQHDRATDPRYLKAGDPADGYRFTVKEGLTSAKDA